MHDQISRDLFIFNKVHLPLCLSEALCFKCWMSSSRNYLCLLSLREEDITRRFHSSHPQISRRVRASLFQQSSSASVDHFKQERKPEQGSANPRSHSQQEHKSEQLLALSRATSDPARARERPREE